MTAFLVGAPASHSGKSTVAASLLRAFSQRGLRVQPFKCGPDYIDTRLHELACGVSSVNLDTFLSSPAHVKELFSHYGKGMDVCLVEGVMGLYDGYHRDEGSSASIASLLGIPVVLVVDARAAAYSVAPLIHGFATFRNAPRIAGVIFNNVGSPRHLSLLREACDEAGVRHFGHLPRNRGLALESRHLGLSLDKEEGIEAVVSLGAKEAERHIDINALLGLCEY